MAIHKILDLIQEKNKLQLDEPQFTTISAYIEALKKEIDEVSNEIKPDNKVYLTDELSDVLWNYLNLVQKMQEQWLIHNIDEVFTHCEEKFSYRIEERKKWLHWNEIKKIQKEKLTIKHSKQLQ